MLWLPLFFVSPYLILIASLMKVQSLDWAELQWSARITAWQSLLSAVGALTLGFVMALGLLRLDGVNARLGRWARVLLVLPSLLPPFFVILTTFIWVDPFPYGILGIAITHSFQFAGLLAVSLALVLVDRCAQLSEISWCLGASRWQFFRAIWPLLRGDFLAHALFVFLMSFASFSIPLVVGGGRGTTLEILIYEKLRINGDVGVAVAISLLQTLVLSLLTWFLPRQLALKGRARPASPLLASSLGTGVIAFSIFCFAWPWIWPARSGFSQLGTLPDFFDSVLWAFVRSFFYALQVSVLVALILLALSTRPLSSFSLRFMRIYFPASFSLVGLAGIAISHWVSSHLLYVLGLTLLFAPMVFRFGFVQKLAEIEPQLQVARVLGSSARESWRFLTVPQVWPRLCFLAALSFVWSFGDFALAKFFLSSGSTLPLLIENLMTSYRIDAAVSLGLLVLLVSGAAFLTARSLGRVFN